MSKYRHTYIHTDTGFRVSGLVFCRIYRTGFFDPDQKFRRATYGLS